MLMTDIKLLVKYITFCLETKIILYYIYIRVMAIRICMKHNVFQISIRSRYLFHAMQINIYR